MEPWRKKGIDKTAGLQLMETCYRSTGLQGRMGSSEGDGTQLVESFRLGRGGQLWVRGKWQCVGGWGR